MNRSIRFKLHNTVALGKKGKIVAPSHKKTRAEPAPPLPYDNAARTHELPAGGLYAQPLGVGITPVSGTALTFSMRHVDFP